MPPVDTCPPPHPSGTRAWRSLEEYAGSPDFRAWLEREFPRQAAVWDGTLSRRQFLKLAAASLALAGLGACGVPPREQIVPYVRQPDPSAPGRPLFFATAMPLSGYGLGLLVESHEGRPTKVEGNPSHPASLGATDVFAQASVLDLYDPARSQAPRRLGRVRPWEEFWEELAIRLETHTARGGAGLRILTETVSSPTLAAGLRQWLERLPNAAWHQYEPLNRDNARAGALLAFGRDVEAVYQLERAEVIVTLDADVFTSGPAAVRYAHDFASRRRPENGSMSRLYAVESGLSPTGALADHRLPLRASEVESLAWALTASLGAALPQAVSRPWVNALVRDLDSHRGTSLVIPGQGQPPNVHALAHSLNAALGNAGQNVRYIEPVAAEPVAEADSLRTLVEAMEAGEVETLLILGGNPAYTAPADLGFAQHLSNIGLSVYLGLYPNETSTLAHWHLPETHFMEAWSDVRAFDGTASLIQPLLRPLYASLTPHELIARLAGEDEASAYDLVRATWQREAEGEDFEEYWRTALHDGIVAGTASPALAVAAAGPASWGAAEPDPAPTELELVFRADPSLYDGRFAHNAWLQELPRPITHLTWDNAVLLSPATAAQLGVANEDMVELTYRGRSMRAPVWVVPGHAPGSLSLSLGYSQAPSEPDSERMGFDAYALRPSDAPWGGTGLRVAKTGERYALATTQHHHLVEGRDLLRMGTLQQYNEEPGFAHAGDEEHVSLYPEPEQTGERWGMVIDLSVCTGCNACVAACQSENNVPVVGKEQVRRGREMHWLRVDSYFFGEPESPMVGFQPVPCMHCEQAPCEPVCPVGATVHSSDGLNEMVYNRCVGTRYCSNNCPYKVRRFNFLEFNDLEATPTLKLRQNPDVTVRSRGVMEKCTYCVQRIRSAQGSARAEGRAVADGEVVTACQGACPTQAIVFGDLNDPQGRTAQLRAQPRNYAMLAELNTRPRTTYLAAVRNVNPEIQS